MIVAIIYDNIYQNFFKIVLNVNEDYFKFSHMSCCLLPKRFALRAFSVHTIYIFLKELGIDFKDHISIVFVISLINAGKNVSEISLYTRKPPRPQKSGLPRRRY